MVMGRRCSSIMSLVNISKPLFINIRSHLPMGLAPGFRILVLWKPLITHRHEVEIVISYTVHCRAGVECGRD